MYIEKTDLEQGVYAEVLDVVGRNEENINNAIAEAIAEIRSYLCARYDMDTEFAKTGNSRNVLVKKMVRDVAIYNCFKVSNPVNMPESRIQTYKDTISFLKDIQKEQASIEGLTRLDPSPATGSNYIKFGGNTKRKNQY